ncbi:MAG: hypothetical protein ABSH56_02165 [Bryobacteraceae bacterium]|jgi:hypothetical protein
MELLGLIRKHPVYFFAYVIGPLLERELPLLIFLVVAALTGPSAQHPAK